MELQKQAIPAVAVVTATFEHLARTVATGMGLAALPIVSLRADLEHLPDEEVRAAIDASFSAFEKALGLPAASPLPGDRPQPRPTGR